MRLQTACFVIDGSQIQALDQIVAKFELRASDGYRAAVRHGFSLDEAMTQRLKAIPTRVRNTKIPNRRRVIFCVPQEVVEHAQRLAATHRCLLSDVYRAAMELGSQEVERHFSGGVAALVDKLEHQTGFEKGAIFRAADSIFGAIDCGDSVTPNQNEK